MPGRRGPRRPLDVCSVLSREGNGEDEQPEQEMTAHPSDTEWPLAGFPPPGDPSQRATPYGMPAKTLSQRDGIEILDRALVLSLAHFKALTAAAVPAFLGYFAGLRVWAHTALPLAVRLGGLMSAFGFLGVSHGMVALATWDCAHGRPVNVPELLRRIGRRGVGVFLSYVLKMLVGVVGLLLLLFPGLHVFAVWFGIPSVNVIEDVDVGPGFRRSMQLAKGAYAGIITSTGCAYLIFVIMNYGLELGFWAVHVRPGTTVYLSAAFLLNLLSMPLRGANGTLLYLELRTRTEGYDLQSMLAALPRLSKPARTPPWA